MLSIIKRLRTQNVRVPLNLESKASKESEYPRKSESDEVSSYGVESTSKCPRKLCTLGAEKDGPRSN